MSLTIEATYENGVLKLDQPLPLKEHEKIQITVHLAEKRVLETYGMVRWPGDLETLDRLAIDPEFDPQESA